MADAVVPLRTRRRRLPRLAADKEAEAAVSRRQRGGAEAGRRGPPDEGRRGRLAEPTNLSKTVTLPLHSTADIAAWQRRMWLLDGGRGGAYAVAAIATAADAAAELWRVDAKTASRSAAQ